MPVIDYSAKSYVIVKSIPLNHCLLNRYYRTLQMKKIRPRVVEWTAQSCTTGKEIDLDTNSVQCVLP